MLLLALVPLCTRSFHRGFLLTLLCCCHLAVCCRCHKCRNVKERLEKCCQIPNAIIICNNCTAFETSGAHYFLVCFFFFFLGLCIPYLHLSGLRDTTAICLYFSNPPVWTPRCGDYWECVTQAANFIIFSLYKHPHYSLPHSAWDEISAF